MFAPHCTAVMKHTVCFLVLFLYVDAADTSCKVADFAVQENLDLKKVSQLLSLSLSLFGSGYNGEYFYYYYYFKMLANALNRF